MNTLEEFAIFVFVYLSLCVQAARNWKRRDVRPWAHMDWLWAIYYGFGVCCSPIVVVYLVTHPDAIQPAPTLVSWLLGLGLANALLGLLLRLAVHTRRRMRHLGG